MTAAWLPGRLRWRWWAGLLFGLLGLLPTIGYAQILPTRPDSTGLFIPKDDASPHAWPTTRVWVGDTARLQTRDGELLTVSTTNGRAQPDPADSLRATCWLIPVAAGPLRVRTTQRVWLTDSSSVVIRTTDSFVAIPRPALRLVVEEAPLRRREVRFRLVDARTGRPAPRRYAIGGLIPPIDVLNAQRRRVATISSFGPRTNDRTRIVPGNVLRIPPMAIRDEQTDLLLWTPAFEYRIH